MHKHIRTIVVAGGIAVALAGCGTAAVTGMQSGNSGAAVAGANTTTGSTGATTGQAPGNSAQPPSGTAPAQGDPAQGQAGSMRGMRGGGVMGTITAVNGSTLTVQDQRQNSTVTVAMSSTTQILKDSATTLANVQAGQTLIATGTQSGSNFAATQIRVGSADSMSGPVGGPGGRGGQPGGAPPANGQAGPGGQTGSNTNSNSNSNTPPMRQRGNRLVGTVTQVGSDAITVKLADGSTVQVTLASNGQITQQVAGTSADLVANTHVLVMGQRTDSTVAATRITIVPAMAQPQS